MARKGKSNGGSAFGGYKFINVYLSADDKRRLEQIYNDAAYPIDGLLGLVSEGYKVSMSHDVANHSFICSLTDNDPASPTTKHILSGRGRTALSAWYAVCYRHFELLSGDWTTHAETDDSEPSMFA